MFLIILRTFKCEPIAAAIPVFVSLILFRNSVKWMSSIDDLRFPLARALCVCYWTNKSPGAEEKRGGSRVPTATLQTWDAQLCLLWRWQAEAQQSGCDPAVSCTEAAWFSFLSPLALSCTVLLPVFVQSLGKRDNFAFVSWNCLTLKVLWEVTVRNAVTRWHVPIL